MAAVTATLIGLGTAQANELTIGGYLEFVADYGTIYDRHDL